MEPPAGWDAGWWRWRRPIPDLDLVAAIDSASHPELGIDAGLLAGVGPVGINLSSNLAAETDALVVFSLPEATDSVLQLCLGAKIPLVFATTGLSAEQESRLTAAAEVIPILRSPNMSMAVNLAMKLSEVAARALKGQDADVEILERHHRFKEDSPSGTALKFGQIISDVMGQSKHVHGREGRIGRRPHGEIGYHAIRVGDNPGEHTIVFAMLGETVGSPFGRPVAIATPSGPWPPPSFSPARNQGSTAWKMSWGCDADPVAEVADSQSRSRSRNFGNPVAEVAKTGSPCRKDQTPASSRWFRDTVPDSCLFLFALCVVLASARVSAV